LYFFYVKLFADTLSAITPLTFTSAAKIASIIPLVVLVFVARFNVAPKWGKLCGAFFAFCVTAMPQMLHYGKEIRMYSLGLLFVTLAVLSAYGLMRSPTAKNFVYLTLFSALSAYTHNFACISAIFVYVSLFIWYLRKDRKQIIKLIASGIGVVVLYLPWLAAALKAFQRVSGDFWIEKITLRTLAKIGIFPFRIGIGGEWVASITVFGICVYLGLRYLINNRLAQREYSAAEEHFVLSGVLIAVFTVLTGVVVSFLATPIFTSRYMFPSLGCFWLAFAVSLTYVSTAKGSPIKAFNETKILLGLILIGAALCNTLYFAKDEIAKYSNWQTTSELFREIRADDAIVTDHGNIAEITAYVTKANKIYFKSNPMMTGSAITLNTVVNPHISYKWPDIEEICGRYSNIYIMLTNQDKLDSIIQYLDEKGIGRGYVRAYSFEFYKLWVIKI
jgi:hypothetical protein